MRVAIAGLGTAAQRGHLPVLERLVARGAVDVVAAADPDVTMRDQSVHRLPHVPLLASAEAMIADVECDLLVVAAEPGAHERLVTLALERRLHVLCEKPLVLTRLGYERVAQAYARCPEVALVSVHQYRYSPGWIAISRWARRAARLRVPFFVAADVHRESLDALAVRPWRSDVDRSGGMLADHGVHFLALGWSIDQELDVLAVARSWSEAGELSSAFVRLGSGALALSLRTGAPARRTRLAFEAGNVTLTWSGATLALALGRRPVITRAVLALADRDHVDSLYTPLYDDLTRNLARAGWRAHRSAETLAVARALLALLEDCAAPRAAAEAR